MKKLAKRWFFPGFDLHTRWRYRKLPNFFRSGPVDTLDAGCGNGALSYAAYKKGNRVLGVSLDAEQIARNQAYFDALSIQRENLAFEVLNLYDLAELGRKFDQIICSEALEHIREDSRMVQAFYELLRPGGVLHLCCPFALHPQHHLGRVDAPEDGGHVRDGYTFDSYQKLLEPVGFEITDRAGVGGATLVRLDDVVRATRNRWGDLFAFPLFLAAWPVALILDEPLPLVPFSVYVRAVKPSLV